MRRHDFRRRYRKGKKVNTHHLIPRAVGGRDTADNRVVLDRRLHDVIHMLWSCHQPTDYLAIATRDPEEFARRTVRAIARTFGPNVVLDGLRAE